jgi:hypothetical protein
MMPVAIPTPAYAARRASTNSSTPSITKVGGACSNPSGRANFPSQSDCFAVARGRSRQVAAGPVDALVDAIGMPWHGRSGSGTRLRRTAGCRGERASADTPSPILLIPVTNVPSYVHVSSEIA